MSVDFRIPIVIFVVMIGISILISFGQNSYESEDHDSIVAGFRELLAVCERVDNMDDYDAYIEVHNSFIDEYGEFNRFENYTAIVSGNYEVMPLIDELMHCENQKEAALAYYPEYE